MGEASILMDSPHAHYATDWSKDGRTIVFEQQDSGSTLAHLWALSLDGELKPVQLTSGEFEESEGVLSPEALVDRCLDLMGPMEVSEETRASLVEYVAHQGDLSLQGHQPGDEAEKRVGALLSLASATKEFQLA